MPNSITELTQSDRVRAEAEFYSRQVGVILRQYETIEGIVKLMRGPLEEAREICGDGRLSGELWHAYRALENSMEDMDKLFSKCCDWEEEQRQQ